MRIDILHFAGCPNHPPTAEMVRDVVQSLGLDATIREFEVSGAAAAARMRYFGSPTVQVNGQDVDPAARDRVDFSFGCRLYGRSGSPPRALMEKALREATAGKAG